MRSMQARHTWDRAPGWRSRIRWCSPKSSRAPRPLSGRSRRSRRGATTGANSSSKIRMRSASTSSAAAISWIIRRSPARCSSGRPRRSKERERGPVMARVTEIRYVGYGVPNLEAERAFYRDQWGLREVAEVEGIVYFAAEGTDERYVVRLRPSGEKRIDVIGLAADTRADVDQLCAQVREAGCK